MTWGRVEVGVLVAFIALSLLEINKLIELAFNASTLVMKLMGWR